MKLQIQFEIELSEKECAHPLAGDLPANHQATFRYNGTDMILQNPATLVDHDHSAAGKGAQITATGVTAVLGTWDAAKSFDTVYQAATDLFVTAYSTGA